MTFDDSEPIVKWLKWPSKRTQAEGVS